MQWGGPDFVLVIVGICTGGWVLNTWIRARHGYALEDEWGGKTERADHAAAARLAEENAQLRARLEALENRTASLETIVTDTGYTTAAQIESLRAPLQKAASQ
ncbi:hypothetical protein [Novosphingobium resinovorum]|uniref:Uncharacterized protein n=1 Tax=Novosphingobium resinovorum TaxID=158500 RepID=A0A1D8A8D6_9SPHN|nr:hypothetical protein [Novosphingobium resinovorum]AOR78369.1 hypothetical protein BES08_17630 [Novosphingobium resinovorum]